jgi:hypothetical protein
MVTGSWPAAAVAGSGLGAGVLAVGSGETAVETGCAAGGRGAGGRAGLFATVRTDGAFSIGAAAIATGRVLSTGAAATMVEVPVEASAVAAPVPDEGGSETISAAAATMHTRPKTTPRMSAPLRGPTGFFGADRAGFGPGFDREARALEAALSEIFFNESLRSFLSPDSRYRIGPVGSCVLFARTGTPPVNPAPLLSKGAAWSRRACRADKRRCLHGLAPRQTGGVRQGWGRKGPVP